MIAAMSGMAGNGLAGHFARQMKKERLAHGWSLAELGRRTGLDPAHLGRVESGRRPPTVAIAAGLDTAFPSRRGWFSEWLSESREWSEMPATFRSWPDYEDRATAICTWTPGIIDGLAQTDGYARALAAVQPDATPEVIAARVTARMERQRRILGRDAPPSVWIIIDELALYRQVGSPDIMSAQLRHLAQLASVRLVTLTVMPAVGHAANASGFVLAGEAAWCEHLAGGYVLTDEKSVTALERRFDSLRGECYRVSESLALIERLAERWTTGASPLKATETAASA
jgi:transcriptional regulator with XRE-family HTH domain